tara:strand:+ start:2649 stop:3617 length:969 start_codon:yes stop_codon:yes gene_type:complete
MELGCITGFLTFYLVNKTEGGELNILKKYQGERDCRDFLYQLRWPEGCPNCRMSTHSWYIPSQRLYKCKRCRYRLLPLSGTIFQKTKVPLAKWFKLISIMSTSEEWIPIIKLGEEVGIKDYKIIWTMVHKVRTVMSQQYASKSRLLGLFELNSLISKKSFSKKKKDTIVKGEKIIVVISEIVKREEWHPLFFIHIFVTNSLQEEIIKNKLDRLRFLKEDINIFSSLVGTQGFEKYSDSISGESRFAGMKRGKSILPQAFNAFRSVGSLFENPTTGVSKKILLYLMEICFRSNNISLSRKEKIEHLLYACATTTPVTNKELFS